MPRGTLGLVMGLWLAWFLLGCAREPQSSPTPTPEDIGRLSLTATLVPLEPWETLRGQGLRPAPVQRGFALWTGSVLRLLAVGTLPTPCHRLRGTVRPNTPPGTVEFWLYMQPPQEDCQEQPTDFEVEMAVQPPFLPVRVLLNGQDILLGR